MCDFVFVHLTVICSYGWLVALLHVEIILIIVISSHV